MNSENTLLQMEKCNRQRIRLFGKYKNNKLCLLLTLYIDDILISRENKEITKVVTKIKHKYKVSTDKGENKMTLNVIFNINILYIFNCLIIYYF